MQVAESLFTCKTQVDELGEVMRLLKEFVVGRPGLIAGVIFFLATTVWYLPTEAPLSAEEVDAYMETYQRQMEQYSVRHDTQALRQLLMEDDGAALYTVNLYKFHDRAAYVTGSDFAGSGEEAYSRFSAVMVKLLAARASHPIFGSNWSDPGASGWDRVVIVRYRSRRDLANLFATNEFALASEHKWAAIKHNERMIVQAVHLPEGLLAVGILSLLAALLVRSITFTTRLISQVTASRRRRR